MKLWRYGRPIEILGERYRLDGMLGSGGMAEVVSAWDEYKRRQVAIKILRTEELDQRMLNRFVKESALGSIHIFCRCMISCKSSC